MRVFAAFFKLFFVKFNESVLVVLLIINGMILNRNPVRQTVCLLLMTSVDVNMAYYDVGRYF